MPVVYRQVAVLPEMANDVAKRLIRLEGQTLAAVSAAVRIFSVRHNSPKVLDVVRAKVVTANVKLAGTIY